MVGHVVFDLARLMDGQHRFLKLLATEAPTGDFEEVVAAARREGRSEAELRALQADLILVLQIRATLQERRRREAELAALNETASDLTSIRDVGRALQAIVRRARQLLGTDTSYLTLIDEERGDTYIRVTEGITSGEILNLRLGFDTGLGGLVARTANPYATSNYLTDPRFNHTATVDVAVRTEGLVAILGVPLLLGDKVIGVLFAANRRERPFSAEEIALLSSLAAHAAVVIENARLFTDAQRALAELNEANRTIQRHSDDVERAATAHERLTQLVLQGGGVDDVAGAVADLFGAGVLVLASERSVIAAAGGASAESMGDGMGTALREAQRTGRTVVAGECDERWVMAPVVAGDEQLGAFVLTGLADPGDVDLAILERAAQVTALLLLNQRSVAEAEQRIRGEFLADLLLAPDRDPPGLRRRARLLSADLDRPHAVVVAAAKSPRHQAASVAASHAAEAGGLVAEHNGQIVLLLPDQDPAESARRVSSRLGKLLGCPVTAGGAGPAIGPLQIAGAHQDAARCVRLLQALRREGEAATEADLGIFGLLLGRSDPGDIDQFVQRTIGPVLGYDAKRGTHLIETLEEYFAHGGNAVRASEVLYVHPNTLYQRMDRIAELIGERWRGPDDGLQVQLALKLHRLRASA